MAPWVPTVVCLEQFFIQGLQPATAAIVGFVGMLATFPTRWCAPYHSRGKLFTKISIYTIYIYQATCFCLNTCHAWKTCASFKKGVLLLSSLLLLLLLLVLYHCLCDVCLSRLCSLFSKITSKVQLVRCLSVYQKFYIMHMPVQSSEKVSFFQQILLCNKAGFLLHVRLRKLYMISHPTFMFFWIPASKNWTLSQGSPTLPVVLNVGPTKRGSSPGFSAWRVCKCFKWFKDLVVYSAAARRC